MNGRKGLSLVLTGAMMVSMLSLPAMAADTAAPGFPDAAGSWASESIDRWGSAGVVNGDENGVVVGQNPRKGEYVSNGTEVAITLEVTDSGITEGTSADGAAQPQTTAGTASADGTPQTSQNGTSAAQPQTASNTPIIPTTTKKTGKTIS